MEAGTGNGKHRKTYLRASVPFPKNDILETDLRAFFSDHCSSTMMLFSLNGIPRADFILAGLFEKPNVGPLPSSVKPMEPRPTLAVSLNAAKEP
jgi:hypothetical protein